MDLLIILLRPSLRPVVRAAAATFLVLLACWVPVRGAAAASLEFPVKAAYLSKFGIYVEWPPGTFAAPNAPLVLCVAGDDPFGATLDQAAADQRIEGHPVVVRRLNAVSGGAGCQILYLDYGEPQSMQKALDAVRGKPVLTVIDADDAVGGIIRFVIRDNRVRFNIDDAEAQRSGLKISSKLLSLALNVRPR